MGVGWGRGVLIELWIRRRGGVVGFVVNGGMDGGGVGWVKRFGGWCGGGRVSWVGGVLYGWRGMGVWRGVGWGEGKGYGLGGGGYMFWVLSRVYYWGVRVWVFGEGEWLEILLGFDLVRFVVGGVVEFGGVGGLVGGDGGDEFWGVVGKRMGGMGGVGVGLFVWGGWGVGGGSGGGWGWGGVEGWGGVVGVDGWGVWWLCWFCGGWVFV
uniref:Uncharacterized protein n=1 Tax=Knipowitschia caucasica TaxID=637954 RepID=A0AAV2IZJ9_KNICA